MNVDYHTGPCIMCGDTAAITLDRRRLERWQSGTLIQNAFPDLAPEVREMMITGTHPDCWNDLFGGDDEDS